MPLPDERPRPSVANLIGRFEKETKRLSVSTNSPSRSSSVVSHTTNDSAKEELKEKREWPPRSDGPSERPPIVIPGYVRPQISTASDSTLTLGSTVNRWKKDATEPTQTPETPLTAKALDASLASNPEPASAVVENWRKEIPEGQPEPADVQTVDAPPVIEADLPTPTPGTTKKFTGPPPRTPATARSTAAKATPSAVNKTPAVSRAPQKGTPAHKATAKPSAPPVTQALKPQLTGQSTVSASSSKRTATKPPVPPVSIRAKTPSRPDASRAKTPTSSTPRAKTPSTGLFAPTAASLARSRSAVPPVPTPVKKATLSTDVMDRLSKPTAASLSKTRSLNPQQTPVSPPRSATNAKAAPKSATLSSSTSKQSMTPSSSKMSIKSKASSTASSKTPLKKEPAASSKPASGAAVAATVAAIGAVAATEVEAQELTTPSVDPTENVEDDIATGDGDAESEGVVDDRHRAQEHVQPRQEEQDTGAEDVVEEQVSTKSPTFNHPDTSISSELSELTQLSEEGELSTVHAPKDDLLDIVNMLEGSSIKASSTKSGDELLEIPDEDDK